MGQKSREVEVHVKEDVKTDADAKRNKYLMRNHLAAHKCRERNKTQITELLKA
jgi:hypothetical protein